MDLPQDRAHDHVDNIMKHVKDLLIHLRRLFLVEDVCESVKFGLFLWALTYVGEYVSGTTLIILGKLDFLLLCHCTKLCTLKLQNTAAVYIVLGAVFRIRLG